MSIYWIAFGGFQVVDWMFSFSSVSPRRGWAGPHPTSSWERKLIKLSPSCMQSPQPWRPERAASESDAPLCFKASVMHRRWSRLRLQHSGWYQKHFSLGAQPSWRCELRNVKWAWLWEALLPAIYVSTLAFMPKFIYIIRSLCYVLFSFYNKLYISANSSSFAS